MKKALFVLVFSNLLVHLWSLVASAHPATVLIIESYHSCFEWDKQYVHGIRSVLEPEHTVLTFEMDTKRLPRVMHSQKAKEAVQMLDEVKPDLVVIGDDNASALLGKTLLERKIPLVYIGVNENPRKYNFYGWPHVAGVVERPLFKPSIRLAARIVSGRLNKVLFLTDASRSSHLLMDDMFRRSEPCEVLGVKVETVFCETMAEWRRTVLAAKDKGFDAVFVGLYQTLDSVSGVMDSDDVLEWTSRMLPIPLFAFWDFSVKEGGAVGGLVHSGLEQGRIAGELALDLLNGRRGEIVPREVEQGVLLFSRAELARWKITIPPELASSIVYVK